MACPSRPTAHDNHFTGAFLPPDRAGDSALERVHAEIGRLGLQPKIRDLDTLGYTVLSPAELGSDNPSIQLREAVLQIFGATLGAQPNSRNEANNQTWTAVGRGHLLHHVLGRNLIFERALLHPPTLALITYLLGESCVLSSMNAMLKAAGPGDLELHTDQVGTPAPFPAYAQVANATWALTDCTRDSGPIIFVPGSHKWCRHPTRQEAMDLSAAVPVEAKSGSLIVWHGNTWHGARARKSPGYRINLMLYFCRWYLLPQALYRQTVPGQMLARNPERFSVLMGRRTPYSGADFDGSRPSMALGQTSQFA